MDKSLFKRLVKSAEQMVMIEKGKLVVKTENITEIPKENVRCVDLKNPRTLSQNLNKY